MSERDMGSIMMEADRLAKELEDLEEENRRRRAMGKPPLPGPQERADKEVARRKHKTGYVTVDGDDVLSLYSLRKAQMKKPGRKAVPDRPEDYDDDDDIGARVPIVGNGPVSQDSQSGSGVHDESQEDRAVREAAAVRRVEDMKNGRINHESAWSEDGHRLEGGDGTSLPENPQAGAWKEGPKDGVAKSVPAQQKPRKASGAVSVSQFEEFRDDLYRRLGISFDGIERTLSDLQGRVSEIVTASAASAKAQDALDKTSSVDESAFTRWISGSTPVTFEIDGTKMSFDAIMVYHAAPCITVVSKFGSATITPKPTARLLMSYTMDGKRYVDDPVIFLGSRFDLPIAGGLSFVGFIRLADAGGDFGGEQSGEDAAPEDEARQDVE